VHFYDYKHDCEDITTFPAARFVSEFGYQSLPSLETMDEVTIPTDRYRDSPLMQYRQRHEHVGCLNALAQMPDMQKMDQLT
jgi:beta-mannosidase